VDAGPCLVRQARQSRDHGPWFANWNGHHKLRSYLPSMTILNLEGQRKWLFKPDLRGKSPWAFRGQKQLDALDKVIDGLFRRVFFFLKKPPGKGGGKKKKKKKGFPSRRFARASKQALHTWPQFTTRTSGGGENSHAHRANQCAATA